jgi:tetratricopeptide (TPR) repeat protein
MNDRATAAEAAWAKFEAGDVGALEPLGLQLGEVDPQSLGALQRKARGPAGAARDKAIDELAILGARTKAGVVFDVAIAGALDDAGEHGRALDARITGLPLTPTWHPDLASRHLGNLGWSFQKVGDHASARRFFERARRFDPTNPFVLSSLAEIEAAEGDVAWARGVRRWLDEHGFPAATLDELLAKRPGDEVKPFAPGLDGLAVIDGRGFAKLVACLEADRQSDPHAILRALAIGTAMRGERAVARLHADEALGLEAQGVSTDDDDRAWAKAIAALLATAGESAPADPQARAEALDEAIGSGDHAALRPLLADPIGALRTIAAEALADDDARALLRELSAAEAALGVAARPPSAHGASWAQYRLRAKDLGPRPLRVLPAAPGDVAWPTLEDGDGLVAWLTFDQVISPEDAAWIDAQLKVAAQAVATAEPSVGVYTDHRPQTFQLVLRGVRDARLVAGALAAAFAGEGSRLAELVLGAYHLPDGEDRKLFAPIPRPGSKLEPSEYPWASAFDAAAPPPPSEPEDGPSFLMMQSPEGHVPEVRLEPVEIADVRVVWGLPNVDGRVVADGSPEADRERAVRRAIDGALDAAFRGRPPARRNRAGEIDGALDTIRHRGRDGFAFAIDGLCPELVVHTPCGFRIREHERLEAMAAVTRATGLAPVVFWERSGGTWIVNLWAA